MKKLGMKSLTLGLIIIINILALVFIGESFYWDVQMLGGYTLLGSIVFALFYLLSTSVLLWTLHKLFKNLEEIQKDYDNGYSESGVELEMDRRGDHVWD